VNSTVTSRWLLGGMALVAVWASLPVRVQTDSVWTVPTAVSLARQLDTDLAEYGRATDELPHGLARMGPEVHSTFPIGPAVIAAVAVALTDTGARVLAHLPAPLDVPFRRWLTESSKTETLDHGFFTTFEVIVASLCVAIGVVAFLLTCRAVSRGSAPWVAAAALAFGSAAVSTWTRSLWSHGPAFCFLALAAFAALGRRGVGRWAFAGTAAAAFAVVCRPTAAPAAVVLAAVLVAQGVRRSKTDAGLALLGGGLVTSAWLGWSFDTWGSLLPGYYQANRLELTGAQVTALMGNLVSPSRGLLIYAPVVVLGLGAPLVRPRPPAVFLIAWALGLLHVGVVSLFPHWWGGHCYGARLPSDAVPFFLFAGLPVLERWLASRPLRVLVVALVAVSLAINLRGAIRSSTWQWNVEPRNVDDAPERVWDWSDPQFAR
jgi:hypothetical protein